MKRQEAEKVRCLVCGRELPREDALHETYEGRELWFCSPRCQARFECDPEAYLGETQALECPPGYS